MVCKAAEVNDRAALAGAAARRWGYLDILHPPSAALVSELLSEHRLREMAWFTRIAQHVHASHITAALGGEFVWGPADLRLIASRNEYPELADFVDDIAKTTEDANQRQFDSQALEYFLTRITETDPFQIVDPIYAPSLIRFLERSDNIVVRNELLELVDQLVVWARREDIPDAKVADYEKLVEDYRGRLKSLQRGVGIVGAAGAGAIGAQIGVLVAGMHGAVMGGTVGAALGGAVGASHERVAHAMARLFWKEQNRVFLTTESLRKRA